MQREKTRQFKRVKTTTIASSSGTVANNLEGKDLELGPKIEFVEDSQSPKHQNIHNTNDMQRFHKTQKEASNTVVPNQPQTQLQNPLQTSNPASSYLQSSSSPNASNLSPEVMNSLQAMSLNLALNPLQQFVCSFTSTEQ